MGIETDCLLEGDIVNLVGGFKHVFHNIWEMK